VQQQGNEETSVSQADLEVTIRAEQIANILNHTICKTELVVSTMNILAVINRTVSFLNIILVTMFIFSLR
jgi:hypothetical protein